MHKPFCSDVINLSNGKRKQSLPVLSSARQKCHRKAVKYQKANYLIHSRNLNDIGLSFWIKGLQELVIINWYVLLRKERKEECRKLRGQDRINTSNMIILTKT